MEAWHEHLDGELLSIIQEHRWLYQWWAFIALFVVLTVGWTCLLCTHAPTWWLLWIILGLVFAIAALALGFFFADAGKKNKTPDV